MPLLKAEDVFSFVITDERVRDHLRQAEFLRSRMGFRDYVARFGIHDLGEVSEGQLFALVAARNTAPIIDLLRIPRGKDQAQNTAYASYDLHRPKTSLGPAAHEFLNSVPSSDQEWETLRDPEDIPQAIPEDLLLRRRAPREFLRRLTEGELLRSAWVQDDVSEFINAPVETPEEASRRGQTAAQDDGRPFGYLLLDASESMGTGRDRRDEVARGLALAFLLSQYEAGNPTELYLFRHELSQVFGGETRTQFESAVAAVLGHSHEGMTNLQGTLKLLSGAMRTHTGRVDIALITDGVTRLTENPLGDSHLHTFLVGVRPEEFDRFGAAQYQESILTLQSWSDFMFRLDPDVMSNASVPRREDVLDFAKVLYRLEDELSGSASADKIRRLQARLHNLIRFTARYREHRHSPDVEIDEVWNQAQVAASRFGTSDAVQLSIQNSAQWSSLDRSLMTTLETRELRSLLESSTLGAKWGVQIAGQNVVSPWDILKRILWAIRMKIGRKALKRLIKSVLKKRE